MHKQCKCIMVQGTASSVGKSILVAALCRIFKRLGYQVAPFKAQNMALNTYLTKEGLEMGRAQMVQAEAAGIEPIVQMNPILLKPSTDKKSQVIVQGKLQESMDAQSYYLNRKKFKAEVLKSFTYLKEHYELIIIEGAGSPAEINLQKNDLVNMGMAKMADCPVILISDIDRGGVFAALYGTVKLLPKVEQTRIKGLVINKFRGDIAILEPGLKQIEGLLKIPVLGVIPYAKIDVDDEDSLSLAESAKRNSYASNKLEVAVIKFSYLSEFSDFSALTALENVNLHYVSSLDGLREPDLIILPHTQNCAANLLWLKESGLAFKIQQYARQGAFIYGIGAGFKMLGSSIKDEIKDASYVGLALLDIETKIQDVYAPQQVKVKITEEIATKYAQFKNTAQLSLQGHVFENPPKFNQALFCLNDSSFEGAINIAGNVFGSLMHGLFENSDFLNIYFNNLTALKNKQQNLWVNDPLTLQEKRNLAYDKLADLIEENLDLVKLQQIIFEE